MKFCAFNDRFFGEKIASDNLNFMTGRLNRAIAKKQMQTKR